MAHDLNVNEFKLKDPVRSIPDGLREPVTDSTPGFFQSLRNPRDLWLEESLPASLYQWMTGNTKKKQAQEALDWIRNNHDQKGSKIYQEAERKLNRFGYLLEDGPLTIDFKEVKNMIKANPRLFGAELVNMVMADPWLLFMPLGWHRLGRGVVNAIRLKYSKHFSVVKDTATLSKRGMLQRAARQDMKVGAIATLGVPLMFSTTWQLGEKAEIDPKRTGIETTIGATAGALMSVVFAGAAAMAGKFTQAPRSVINEITNRTYNKYKSDPLKLIEFDNEGHYIFVKEPLKSIRKETEYLQDHNEFLKASTMIQSAVAEPVENIRDMAKNTLLKAATFGGVFATAEFLTEPDEKLLAAAKGFGAGVGIYAAYKGLVSVFGKTNQSWVNAEKRAESALDTGPYMTIRYNSDIQRLVNEMKDFNPDAFSRRRVGHHIMGTKVNENLIPDPSGKPILWDDLSKTEQTFATNVKHVFKDFQQQFGKEGAQLFFAKRSNYLPLIWEEYPGREFIKFAKDFDKRVWGESGKFKFIKRGIFQDINKGIEKGYRLRVGMDDPAELIKIYGFSAGKALTAKHLVRYLRKQTVSRDQPFVITTQKDAAFISPRNRGNYVELDHPFFYSEPGFIPLVHKGVERSLKMVFDAKTERELVNAIFTTNFMMKRMAVGFSFFHAGALFESLLFAGAKPSAIGKILKPRSKEELFKIINDPATYLKEFNHAVKVLRDNGYNDVVKFAQGMGVKISVPEDAGMDIFYHNIRNIDNLIKRHLGINNNKNIEKVFKWFDKITWDQVFTQAKLHTFLSALDKESIFQLGPQGKWLKVKNPNRIMPGDSQEVIYRKARGAAAYTNNAYGGQNWAQVVQEIQTPWLKKLTQTTLNPGSRGYLQLLLFAPDWTISNARIIAKAFPGFESDPFRRRLYQYYALRAALIFATAGSALNYMYSGHSILENTDPTRIDLGNGEVLTFSKQLMEPFHWITAPQSTGLKKIGALPRVTIEVLTNKKYLTTKWSPNITKKDDEAIEKGLKIGGHVGRRFIPIWLQTASQNVAKGLERDGLSADLAADTAVDFVLGQLGHPRYQGPRYTQYKTKGLVRSPYETLF